MLLMCKLINKSIIQLRYLRPPLTKIPPFVQGNPKYRLKMIELNPIARQNVFAFFARSNASIQLGRQTNQRFDLENKSMALDKLKSSRED